MNKIKYAVLGGLALVVAGCGLGQTSNSLEDQVARVEAGYNAAMRVVIEARKPCVDDDPSNDDLCYIDDELYSKIDPSIDRANDALDTAAEYAEAQDEANVKEWLGNFKERFTPVLNVVDSVKDKL